MRIPFFHRPPGNWFLLFVKFQIVLFPILSVASACRRAWTCDDAFISFRYALNLARGYGLVFNRGEYVEGMTNFLWTVMLAPFIRAGLDAEITASYLGLVFYALFFTAVIYLGSSIMPESFRESSDYKSAGNLFALNFRKLPFLTVLSLSSHLHMQIFATSGLETSFFIFLLTAGVLSSAVYMTDSRRRRGFAIAGFGFLALSVLARPDGLIFYGIAALFTAVNLYDDTMSNFDRGEKRIRRYFQPVQNLFIHHAGFVFILVPVWIFRYIYYGSLLPNTFYAKSAYDPYFSQGILYVLLYFKSYYVFVFLFIVSAGLAAHVLIKNKDTSVFSFFDRTAFMLASVIVFWLLYVIQVGGDFMFARFMLPITPILYLFAERWIRMMSYGKAVYISLAALSVMMTLFRYDPYRGEKIPLIQSITEESKVYTPERRVHYREFSFRLKKYFSGTDPVIAFRGGLAGMVYYLDVTTAIEATTGLTDRFIASQKLSARGRIGHEKSAPIAYLASRRVAFVLGTMPEDRDFGYNTLMMEGYPGKIEILTWQPEVMQALVRHHELKFVDFPSYLDNLDRKKGVSRKELSEFERYYFNHVQDEKRYILIKSLVR